MCTKNRDVNKENSDNPRLKSTWLLVSWMGSIPDETFDIINGLDVVFDNVFTPDCLKISSIVMVRCGRTKSPAIVRKISDNTDELMKELRKLQSKSHKENIDPVNTKKAKRPRYDTKVQRKVQENSTQTDTSQNDKDENDKDKNEKDNTEKDKTIQTLTQENQKLKAELYEANKIIKTICKDLKLVVQGVQKKLQDKDEEAINSSDISDNSNQSSISCPVQELQQTVLIGTGKTEVPRQIYVQVNWLSYAAATRKLLMAVFARDILATHSLTGKPSPAFLSSDMPAKNRLDPVKVADIIEIVTSKCGVSDTMVRSAITTKCADENKMYKKRLEKIKKE